MERKITALKAQKRNPDRINVYLEGEFAFGLSRIVAAWLHVGQMLSDEKIKQLQEEDVAEVAFQRALRFLAHRPRSKHEMEQKLQMAGFEPNVVRTVIERLKNSGYLDDQQFSKLWVENRNDYRPRSRRVLAMELRQKGVAEEIIQHTLSENPDEEALAYRAASRYARRLEGLDWETFRTRLSGFLARRGFGYGTISSVVRRAWKEANPTGNHLEN
jgi:regulatory protein